MSANAGGAGGNARVPGPGTFRRGAAARLVLAPEKAGNARGALRRLLGYPRRGRSALAGVLVCVLAGAVSGAAAPAFQGRAVDAVAAGAYGEIRPCLIAMILLYAILAVSSWAQGYFCALLGRRVMTEIRAELFGRILRLPVRRADARPRGDLISRLTNDADNVANVISMSAGTFFSGILTLAATLAMMAWLSVPLTLCACVTIFLSAAFTGILTRRMRASFLKRQEILGELSARVEETLSNYRTVGAYNLGERAFAEFGETSDRLRDAGIVAEITGNLMGPVMNALNNLTFLTVTVCGGLLALNGLVSVGVISAFAVYAKQFGRPVNELAQIYTQIQTALAGAERIFAILDEREEDGAGAELPPGFAGAIEFRDVSFSYVPGRKALDGFSLRIAAGKKTALVGATGSGKTTVINLLLRFYEPDAGVIALDGRDVREIALASLRGAVGVVPQDTLLFSGTLRSNIAGGLAREPTDEELARALRLGGMEAFAARLPRGIDTELADAGDRLSAGERQLIAICRAFVSDPRVLILDEATSSVDTGTERRVNAAAAGLMRDRTCLIIAHRLSTIRDADEIVVMDAGRIAERGTHAELLAARGRYFELYRTQFAGNDI